MNSRLLLGIVGVFQVSAFMVAGTAVAAGPEVNPLSPWYLYDSERRWNFDGLLGVELEPDYVGSDDSETEPTGFARAFFRDQRGNRYTLGLGEVGVAFYSGRKWAFTVDLEFEEGRETENPALAGLPDGESTLEGEFALFRRLGNHYAFAVFQPDLLERGKGIVYFLGYRYDLLSRGERWLWSTGLDVSWGDREHMQTEFGLTAQEASIINQAEYQAPGGLKSATLGWATQRFFGGRWSWYSAVEVEHYFRKASNSPLIETLGSDINFELATGVFFRF